MPKQAIVIVGIIILILVIGAGVLYMSRPGTPEAPGQQATTTPSEESNTAVLAIGQSATIGGISITPKEVVEDSRCPTDVECIQAGRVRLRAGAGGSDQIFIVGEPVTVAGTAITLTEVSPAKVSTVTIAPGDYRFTFKAEKQALLYKNATASKITVDLPAPGAVTGKTFSIKGHAVGPWYFEASFPVVVLDKNGNQLWAGPAQAESDWMTTDFVPFTAMVTVPASYIGPATVILKNDNPSGDPARDASLSFPITIEY